MIQLALVSSQPLSSAEHHLTWRFTVPSKQQKGWLLAGSVMGSVTVGPQDSRKVLVLVYTVLCSSLLQHGFEGAIKSLHHAVAL